MIKETQSIFNRFDKQRIFSVDVEHQEYLVTLGQPMSTAIVFCSTFEPAQLPEVFEVLKQDDPCLAREVVNAMALPEFNKNYKAFIAERAEMRAKEAARNRFNPSFTKTASFGAKEIGDNLLEGLRRCVGL